MASVVLQASQSRYLLRQKYCALYKQSVTVNGEKVFCHTKNTIETKNKNSPKQLLLLLIWQSLVA